MIVGELVPATLSGSARALLVLGVTVVDVDVEGGVNREGEAEAVVTGVGGSHCTLIFCKHRYTQASIK